MTRLTVAVGALVLAPASPAQTPDSLRAHTLSPITVSVTRSDVPLAKIPLAVHAVDRALVSRARPTWGLDEALVTVPGVYAANRYNFSLDQRISIRGFGGRSAFAVRGVRVLLDGIPQTLPDGQGQLTNLELGAVDRIEVLRGPSSALFGNASGGVISIWTARELPASLSAELRLVAGSFDRDLERTWTKWQSRTAFPLGRGGGLVSVSRLSYAGERDHSGADLRGLNARLRLPLGSAWSVAIVGDVGDQPVADNPGALTLAELRANRDSAAPLNLLRRAGKDVRQAQGGLTLHGPVKGGEAAVTIFGLTRDLTNPLPQAYITVERGAWGLRASATRPIRLAGLPLRLTGGLDLQRQRDDRREYAYAVPTGALTTPDDTPDTLTRNQRERVGELGPFVQGTLDVTSRLSVTAGIRYDRVEFRLEDRHLSDGADNSGTRAMEAVSGTVGMALSVSPAVTLYGNIGTAFETPTTTELVNQPPPGGGGFNRELDPQRAVNYEIGLRQDGGGRGGDGGSGGGARLSWSVAVFQANVEDELVAFEDPAVPNRRFFRNAGAARHRGIEAGADVEVAPGVRAAAAWTFADYSYTDYALGAFELDGAPLPGVPRQWLHTLVRARPGFALGAWAELETTHSSGVFVDDTLATWSPGWWTATVRVGWTGAVAGWHVEPFLGLNNVLDRHYVGSVVINAARGRYYEPAPGRNAYVGLTVRPRT